MIENMKGRADDDFMRAWLIVVVSTFMCPTTSLHISPRCYPIVADLERVKRMNFCAFIAKGIKTSLGVRRSKQKAVTCCVHHMVVLYLDSLVVNFTIPDCPIRAKAWDNKRIGKGEKADKKPEGGYGKLRMKPVYTQNRGDGLFVGYEQAEKFVASKLPPTYNSSKKRKIAAMITTLCSEISDKMGSSIEGIGNLDRKDVRNSRGKRPKARMHRDVGGQTSNPEEPDHVRDVSGDDTEYLPSSESGEDGEASSSSDSFDAFVAPRPVMQKQSSIKGESAAVRNSWKHPIYVDSASESRGSAEPAKTSVGTHSSHVGKENQHVETPTIRNEMQGLRAVNTYLPEQHGSKILGDITPTGGNTVTILDVTPISSAPPITPFIAQKVSTHMPRIATAVPCQGTSHTTASTRSCPGPVSQNKGGTATVLHSSKGQGSQQAGQTIREKLRLGPLAQQQAMQHAVLVSSGSRPTPMCYNNQEGQGKGDCPSFDLNISYHADQGTNRGHATDLKPRNLDATMAESGDDWDMDPEELQKVCYAAEEAFAMKKEKESEPIINYNEFFISCKELANSMAPGQKMDSVVAEIAIIALREPGLRPKRRIMPLRVTTYFQNNSYIRGDVDKHFDNKTMRLSRCESISFPTLEILDKEHPKETGHYWVMVLNIRDQRFEVLDSARTLKDKVFVATATKIMDGIKANWERHYSASSVQIQDWKLHEIKCPRQDNSYDCSIYMFHNTDKWDGVHVMEYGPKDIGNLRMILTAKMVKSGHNDVNWAKMLNIKKKQNARQQ